MSENLEEKEAILGQIEIEEKAARLIDPPFPEIAEATLPEAYQGSPFLDKLKRQAEEGHREVLVSDIDWTFYHQDLPSETDQLFQLLEKNGIPIAYCTGRGLEKVVSQDDLPLPDLAIPAVGTEIWVKDREGELRSDQNYADQLRKNWDRSKIYSQLVELVGSNQKIVFQDRDLPDQSDPDLPAQEFKISLNFQGTKEEALELEQEMKSTLGEEIGVIFSTNWREENTFYVDILPTYHGKTGKAMPIQYLKDMIGFRSIVAGDGGNDADMLFNTGSQSIVVGNHLPEMKGILESLPDKDSNWRPKLTSHTSGGERNDVYIADPSEIGPLAIKNALIRGDFNPYFAKKIIENNQ